MVRLSNKIQHVKFNLNKAQDFTCGHCEDSSLVSPVLVIFKYFEGPFE